jgi:hypothetical protein
MRCSYTLQANIVHHIFSLEFFMISFTDKVEAQLIIREDDTKESTRVGMILGLPQVES